MSDLRELYQEVILDHNKSPCNFRKLDGANRVAEGLNPLCGDRVTVYLHMEDDVIQDIGFQGSGCAISKAAASVMTGIVKGKSKAEAQALFERFRRLVTGRGSAGADSSELEEFDAFRGVCEFPARVKCATLAWHTLREALEAKMEAVATE